MLIKHWSEKYIGIKYSDLNCAELVERVGIEQFGLNIEFPKNNNDYISQDGDLKKYFPKFFEIKDSDPEDGDIVLMSGSKELNHIGVFCKINNENYILHSFKIFRSVVLHKINQVEISGLKIVGFYKWLK